ncbi:MAG: hypothetical protein FK733_17700 [Asgard group archaeon]|nr:hypothetical protein [Asgard group archaeon]
MTKATTEQPITEETATEKKTLRDMFNHRVHQFIIIGILHVMYIIFESMNAFNQGSFTYNWISALVYIIICGLTVFMIWREWEKAKYMVPIPFISLIIVSLILGFTEIITGIFVLYCIFYFVMAILKKDDIVAILTVIFSSVTFFLLTSFMRFDSGFVKVNYEVNVVSGILLLLVIASSICVFRNKENFGLLVTYNATFMLLCSILPFIQPEGSNSNTFTLLCAISVLAVGIVTFVQYMITTDQNMIKLLPLVLIEQVGIIILSYAFRFNFNWLGALGKVLIIDYVVFLPLVLFVSVVFAFKFFPIHKDPERESELDQVDFIAIGVFISFLAAAMAMAGWGVGNLNLIKALVVSIIFFGITIPLELKYSASTSLISIYVSLGLMLHFVAALERNIVLLILMSFSAILILFAIINELFIMGEPMTSSMTISGTLMLMVCSLIYFDYIEIWVSLIWALVGLYLFVIGLLFNKIFLRRIGLAVIIIDVIYSIVYVSRLENRALLGVGFMVLAVVLFICIWLFRWSEQKLKKDKLPDEEIEEAPIEA